MRKLIDALIAKFRRDRRGQVSIATAAIAVPTIAIAGAAIEFGQSMAIRSQLQSMLDSALLHSADVYRMTGDKAKAQQAARTMLETMLRNNGYAIDPPAGTPLPSNALNTASTADQLRRQVGTSPYFDFNFKEPEPEHGIVSAQLTNRVDTQFLSLLQIEYLDVSVDSHILLSGNTLEVGLVLDITGSMAGQKLTDMKAAAKDFVDLVMPPGLPDGKSKVAIVPFADHVNVGRDYYNTVVRASNRYAETPNDDKRTCVRERNSSTHRYTDSGPSNLFNGYPQTRNVTTCTGRGDDRVCTTTTETNFDCATRQTLLPLTTDKTALTAKIDSLQADAGTAGHLGTAWGWYTISPNWPSLWPAESDPVPYTTKNHMKVVVIMTDGEYNTRHTGEDSNAQAIATCNAMKQSITDEAGRTKPRVEVYTIGFGVGNNETARNTLISCASGADKYYFPYDGNALKTAFSTIGMQIGAGALGARVASEEEIRQLRGSQ